MRRICDKLRKPLRARSAAATAKEDVPCVSGSGSVVRARCQVVQLTGLATEGAK